MASDKSEKTSKEEIEEIIVAGRIPLKKSTLKYEYNKEKKKGKHIPQDLAEHTFIFDTTQEGFEHTYFWLLDFISGKGYKVNKTQDYFIASELGNLYQQAGTMRTAIEKRASELLQTVGILIKSIVQLLWDLKEFDLRLKIYEKYFKGKGKEKDEGALGLKAIYLTEVDVKKGRGSINVLTTDANFATLRDAFMIAKSSDDVDKLDLNARVKNILKPRLGEYMDWAKRSYEELSSRRKIEKAYLKSQVNALKMYTAWAKPYLIATNRLMPPEKYETDADVISGFNVTKVNVSIRGKKEYKPAPTSTIILPELKKNKVFQVLELTFKYRSFPERIRTPQGQATGFRVRLEVKITPYVFTQDQLDKLEIKEEAEVWKFANLTQESIDAIRKDLELYEAEEKKEEKGKEKPKVELVFVSDLFKGLAAVAQEGKGISKGISELFGGSSKGGEAEPKLEQHNLKRAKKDAMEVVAADAWKLFELYKKDHKLITW